MILRGNYKKVLLLFISTIISVSAQSPSSSYHVKVLLEEKPWVNGSSWHLHCCAGFILFDTQTREKKLIKSADIIIAVKKNSLFLNDVKMDTSKFYLIPQDRYIQLNDKEYAGTFLISHDKKQIYLINSLELEEYVFSVLRTESWPGWPLEVNMALAITSRTYVVGVVLKNKKSTLPYHVKNTNKHQTYSGIHNDQVIKEAVEKTRGIILCDENNMPILAMFDSCCGGVIPAHIEGVNFSDAPYLARPYACTFCKDCRSFNWTTTFSLSHFEQIVKKEHKNLKTLKTVRITKTDKAGLVQKIQINEAQRSFMLTGKKIYSMLDSIKSFCFDITVKANQIIFHGVGRGHHLGLCQWGAREMIRQRYDYKTVLNFYYPNTTLMKLH